MYIKLPLKTAFSSLILASIPATCFAEIPSNVIKNAKGVEMTILNEPMVIAEAKTDTNAVQTPSANTIKTPRQQRC